MSASPAERRQHPRRPARFPLYVALEGEIYQKMVAVAARDVSNGGLAFETRTSLPEGARSTVMLGKLDGMPSTAHIEARVVHCRPLAEGDGYTVGVNFDRFVDIIPEQLMAYVSREPD
jgi:hypothetical protein